MDPVRLTLTVGAVLIGSCVGSFVNVLIFRLPRGRSVVAPRSHCFCCGTELANRDLVPVFSFLFSGRRCRYCGVALTSQYAWVEAVTAVLFGVFCWRYGFSLATLSFCLAGLAMIAAFMTDVHHKIIPLVLNVIIAVAGLGAALIAAVRPTWATGEPTFFPFSVGASLAGAAVGWVLFEAIVRFGRMVYRQEAMGGGDVQLAAAVGTLLGPGRLFWTFVMVSVISGAVIGLLLMATRKVGRRDPIPFGPFLISGALVVLLAPELADLLARCYGLAPLAR